MANNLVDKIRGIIGGVTQQAPKTLNDIGGSLRQAGSNFVNKPLTQARGSVAPINYNNVARQGVSTIRSIPQNTVNFINNTPQTIGRLGSIALQETAKPIIARGRDIALSFATPQLNTTLNQNQKGLLDMRNRLQQQLMQTKDASQRKRLQTLIQQNTKLSDVQRKDFNDIFKESTAQKQVANTLKTGMTLYGATQPGLVATSAFTGTIGALTAPKGQKAEGLHRE